MANVSNELVYSKNLKAGINNFICCQHLEPTFTDTFVNYCINEKNVIHADTGASVLNHCFIFGYLPKRSSEFIEIIGEITER